MKISLTNLVIDTDEIAAIQYNPAPNDDGVNNINIVLIGRSGIYVEEPDDVETLRQLFFSGGLPDVVIPADTILARQELTAKLAETRREITEQMWKLQLLEEEEQIKRNAEMIADIERMGLEAFRRSIRQDSTRMPDLGSIFPPENFRKN